MNNFETLDAQSDICTLATVQPSEVFADESATATTAKTSPRNGVNARNVAYHNLGKPLDKRVEHSALVHRVKFARYRGNLVALAASVHAEVEPMRQALRLQYDTLFEV